jgi:mRNA-degrading endonuclease toxin of MazEF toxin-antitoxin module
MAPALQPYDVVIAWVEFSDHPGIGKWRPAVVIDADATFSLVVAIKVTSHAPRADVAGEVVLRDWESDGLAKPSTARCSQLVELPSKSIGRIIGRLTPHDQHAVQEGLAEVTQANEGR